MRRVAKLGMVLALGVGAVANVACGGSDRGVGDQKGSGDATQGTEGDVTVTSCALAANELLGLEAKLLIKNSSSRASNYFVTVAFESADGSQQLDTGHASVVNLAPGQTSEQTALSLKPEARSAPGKFTCKVAEVNRFAA